MADEFFGYEYNTAEFFDIGVFVIYRPIVRNTDSISVFPKDYNAVDVNPKDSNNADVFAKHFDSIEVRTKDYAEI